MSNYFLINPKEERLNQLREEALNQMKQEFFLMKFPEQKNCPWCVSEYTIIDDDFGQPVSFGLINYCFYCGRKLRRVSNGTKRQWSKERI